MTRTKEDIVRAFFSFSPYPEGKRRTDERTEVLRQLDDFAREEFLIDSLLVIREYGIDVVDPYFEDEEEALAA